MRKVSRIFSVGASFLGVVVVGLLFCMHFALARTIPGTPPDTTYIIMTGKVEVEASVVSIDKGYGDASDFNLRLHVSRGDKTFEYHTDIISDDDLDGIIDSLKASVVWSGKYLLVPLEFGGANAWRCDAGVVEVFMLSDNKLVHVGEAGPEKRKGEYKTGRFHDIYDGLEENGLTSHAGAPLIEIIMHEKDDSMVVDLEETWKVNHDEYSDNRGILDSIAECKGASSIDDDATRQLLFNIALCKYCMKEKEFAHWKSLARRLMDRESFEILNKEISTVEAGDLPNSPE